VAPFALKRSGKNRFGAEGDESEF